VSSADYVEPYVLNVTVFVSTDSMTWIITYESRLKSSWIHIIPFTFSRSGWSVVRSASLANVGTSEKRPSLHLQKVPTRSNEVSPRTFQMTLVAPPS
jgi:hypothetical protein